jgi:pimeloyl-ACP methyl ester carboxylesterase
MEFGFTLGYGPIRVLILSPLLPEPPESNFFEAALRPLFRDCTFQVVDALEAEAVYSEIEKAQFSHFIGFSLGGSILQSWLQRKALQKARMVFVSSPVVITPRLKEQLSPVIFSLENGQVERAFNILNFLVDGKSRKLENPDLAASRLRRGLRILLAHDAKEKVARAKQSILHLVGEKSNLVTQQEIKKGKGQQLLVVPLAGMRVLHERPELGCRIISDFFSSPRCERSDEKMRINQ